METVAGADPLKGFAAQARKEITRAVDDMKPEHIANRTIFQENLRIHLKRLVQKELASEPIIVTTIVEV